MFILLHKVQYIFVLNVLSYLSMITIIYVGKLRQQTMSSIGIFSRTSLKKILL